MHAAWRELEASEPAAGIQKTRRVARQVGMQEIPVNGCMMPQICHSCLVWSSCHARADGHAMRGLHGNVENTGGRRRLGCASATAALSLLTRHREAEHAYTRENEKSNESKIHRARD